MKYIKNVRFSSSLYSIFVFCKYISQKLRIQSKIRSLVTKSTLREEQLWSVENFCKCRRSRAENIYVFTAVSLQKFKRRTERAISSNANTYNNVNSLFFSTLKNGAVL